MGLMLLAFLCVAPDGNLPQFLATPPRDFAALVSPEMALETVGAPTDEAALIALLKTGAEESPGMADLAQAIRDLGAGEFAVRKKARETLAAAGAAARPLLEEAETSEDPEVAMSARELLAELRGAGMRITRDEAMEYAKRLFAMRLLEERKSEAALPALRTVAGGADITLRAAAQEAIAVIEGRGLPERSAKEGLEQVRDMLSAEMALVIVMDGTRNASTMTLAEYAEPLLKKISAADPNDAHVNDHDAGAAERMAEQMISAVGMCGNMRIDAITLVVPNKVVDDHGYAGLIFKGLCDPKRLGAVIGAEIDQARVVHGHTVYSERYDPAFCILDENTLLISVGGGRDGEHMVQFLNAMFAENKKPLGTLQDVAFESVLDDGRLIAAAGHWPTGLTGELAEHLARRQQRIGRENDPEIALMQLVLDSMDTTSVLATVTPEGKVLATATCDDGDAAMSLADSLNGVDGSLRSYIQQRVEGNRGRRGIWARVLGFDPHTPFWRANAASDTVTATAEAKRLGELFLID
jgi:hypothetical protein